MPLGITSALRRDGIFDQVTRAFLMVTLVMPAFWVGILFLTYFSIRLQLFPVAGYGDGWREHLHHLFLPALTIALSIAPLIVRALRTSILEGLGSDYVRTARAKGLREQAVVTTHVLRNALIPAVTLLGLSIGYLMGGTVIVENVFSLPGAGKLLVDAIAARDYPLVQSTTLVFAIPGHPRQSWHRRDLHLPRSASADSKRAAMTSLELDHETRQSDGIRTIWRPPVTGSSRRSPARARRRG